MKIIIFLATVVAAVIAGFWVDKNATKEGFWLYMVLSVALVSAVLPQAFGEEAPLADVYATPTTGFKGRKLVENVIVGAPYGGAATAIKYSVRGMQPLPKFTDYKGGVHIEVVLEEDNFFLTGDVKTVTFTPKRGKAAVLTLPKCEKDQGLVVTTRGEGTLIVKWK